MLKRGMFIQKNCELIQEFSHCDPSVKFEVNKIYNSHMTGSSLWNLFCRESEMLEKSWNVSVRHMFGLSVKTHRCFIEPLSQSQHIKVVLLTRFFSFIEKIRNGGKKKLAHIYNTIKHDCQTTTGNNMRELMLLTNNNKIESIWKTDILKIKYHPIASEDEWKIGCLFDLMNTRQGNAMIEGLEPEEIKEMLEYICVS